jgi:hypothetical protein
MADQSMTVREAPQGVSVGMQPAPDLNQAQLPSAARGSMVNADLDSNPRDPSSAASHLAPTSRFAVTTDDGTTVDLAGFSMPSAKSSTTAGAPDADAKRNPSASGGTNPNPAGPSPTVPSQSGQRQPSTPGTASAKQSGGGQQPPGSGPSGDPRNNPDNNGNGFSSKTDPKGDAKREAPRADQSLTAKPTAELPMWRQGLDLAWEILKGYLAGRAGGSYSPPKTQGAEKQAEGQANTAQENADAARAKAAVEAAQQRARAQATPTGAANRDNQNQAAAQEIDRDPNTPGVQPQAPPTPNPQFAAPPDPTP